MKYNTSLGDKVNEYCLYPSKRKRMASIGVVSLEAYIRKMAIEGHVINRDLSDVRKMVSLLGNYSNNLNQYAKRANETGGVSSNEAGRVCIGLLRLPLLKCDHKHQCNPIISML